MKSLHVWLAAILLCSLFAGCSSSDGGAKEAAAPTRVKNTQKVRILFNVRSDFPSGAVQPDLVTMDSEPLREASSILTGSHKFVIERSGYEPKSVELDVEDQDGDGTYHLSPILKAKERIVRFHVTDKESGDLLNPDQVVVSVPPSGGELESEPPKRIADGAFVRPGLKKLVIQMRGYRNIVDDIAVGADEAPYFLEYQMEKIKED